MGKKRRTHGERVRTTPTPTHSTMVEASGHTILQMLQSTNHTHRMDACHALPQMLHGKYPQEIITSGILPLLMERTMDQMIKVGGSACGALRAMCDDHGDILLRVLITQDYFTILTRMLDALYHGMKIVFDQQTSSSLKGKCYWHDTTCIELIRFTSHVFALLMMMMECESGSGSDGGDSDGSDGGDGNDSNKSDHTALSSSQSPQSSPSPSSSMTTQQRFTQYLTDTSTEVDRMDILLSILTFNPTALTHHAQQQQQSSSSSSSPSSPSSSPQSPPLLPYLFLPLFTELQLHVLECLQVMTVKNMVFTQYMVSHPAMCTYLTTAPYQLVQQAQGMWVALPQQQQGQQLQQSQQEQGQQPHSDSIHTYQYITTAFSWHLHRELDKPPGKHRAFGGLLQLPAIPHSPLELVSVIHVVIANLLSGIAEYYLSETCQGETPMTRDIHTLLQSYARYQQRQQQHHQRGKGGMDELTAMQQQYTTLVQSYRSQQEQYITTHPSHATFSTLLTTLVQTITPSHQLDVCDEVMIFGVMLSQFEHLLRQVVHMDHTVVKQMVMDGLASAQVVNVNMDVPFQLSPFQHRHQHNQQHNQQHHIDGLLDDDGDEGEDGNAGDNDGDTTNTSTTTTNTIQIPYDTLWNDAQGLFHRVCQQYRRVKHNAYDAITTLLDIVSEYDSVYKHDDLGGGDDDGHGGDGNTTSSPHGDGDDHLPPPPPHPIIHTILSTLLPMITPSSISIPSLLRHANLRFVPLESLSVIPPMLGLSSSPLPPSPAVPLPTSINTIDHHAHHIQSFYSPLTNPSISSIPASTMMMLHHLITSPIISTQMAYYNTLTRIDALSLLSHLISIYGHSTSSVFSSPDGFCGASTAVSPSSSPASFLYDQFVSIHADLLSLTSNTMIPINLVLFDRYGKDLLSLVMQQQQQQSSLPFTSQHFASCLPSPLPLTSLSSPSPSSSPSPQQSQSMNMDGNMNMDEQQQQHHHHHSSLPHHLITLYSTHDQHDAMMRLHTLYTNVVDDTNPFHQNALQQQQQQQQQQQHAHHLLQQPPTRPPQTSFYEKLSTPQQQQQYHQWYTILHTTSLDEMVMLASLCQHIAKLPGVMAIHQQQWKTKVIDPHHTLSFTSSLVSSSLSLSSSSSPSSPSLLFNNTTTTTATTTITPSPSSSPYIPTLQQWNQYAFFHLIAVLSPSQLLAPSISTLQSPQSTSSSSTPSSSSSSPPPPPQYQSQYQQLTSHIAQYLGGLSLSPLAQDDNLYIARIMLSVLGMYQTMMTEWISSSSSSSSPTEAATATSSSSSSTKAKPKGKGKATTAAAGRKNASSSSSSPPPAILDAELIHQLIMTMIDIYSEEDRFPHVYITQHITTKLKQFSQPYRIYYQRLEDQRRRLSLLLRKQHTKKQLNLTIPDERVFIKCEMDNELTEEAYCNLTEFVRYMQSKKL